MKVTNTSSRDRVLVLWCPTGMGANGTSSLVLRPGEVQHFDSDVEIRGTYKLVQVTKLVDDPSVVEVEE